MATQNPPAPADPPAAPPAPLAEQVTALQRHAAARLPAETLATFASEVSALAAAGLPEGVAVPGTPMPDGQLLDAHGESSTLELVRDGGPAVIVFYRGAWCPYCNLTLRAYQQQLVPELARRGITLVAVSPQKPDGSLTVQQANELTYAVVSDPGNEIAARLGILTASTEGTRAAQRGIGIDVAALNADGTAGIPMPTVVLVDAGGMIRWIDVHPDYTTRTEPAALLEAVAAHLC